MGGAADGLRQFNVRSLPWGCARRVCPLSVRSHAQDRSTRVPGADKTTVKGGALLEALRARAGPDRSARAHLDGYVGGESARCLPNSAPETAAGLSRIPDV